MNPPPMPPSLVDARDDDHLKLLAIFHYVMAGLTFLGALGGLFYAAMGFFMFRHLPVTPGNTPPPPELGWVFAGVGGVITLVCIALGVCEILSGRWLNSRKNRTFCLVIAAIDCLHFPLGTVLGVFTFMVLLRPSVAAKFDRPL